MFLTNSSLQNFSKILRGSNISHYAANELVGSGTPRVRLFTVWGAKGGQAETTALLTTSEMDLRMLKEDARLEYVAHSRAQKSFYYVGVYLGQGVLQHPAEIELQDQYSSTSKKTIEEFSAMFKARNK